MARTRVARREPAHPLRRTLRALTVWPDARAWLRAAATMAITGAAALVIGLIAGFADWAPVAPSGDWLVVLAILFVLPALAEEIVFRGLLLPVPGIASFRIGMWLSIALFVAWHPLQALTFGHAWSDLFATPAFLAAALVLGIGLTHVRIATGSLWPPIVGHWIVVAAWKLFFAGPF